MYSFSIDYIFNRVYDVLLWIKYVWLFDIFRKNPDEYLLEHQAREWDGLRDRGWFDEYLAAKTAEIPPADIHVPLWQKIAEGLGFGLKDSDGDGFPDASDPAPNDPSNVTAAELKERFQGDYTFTDHVRDLFGLGPKDSDGDAVPDSYEVSHGLDKNNPDSDKDGLPDGQELTLGTDPLNNDTDRDLVIDGRDEAPLDSSVTAKGLDSDGDGVSDAIETRLGTDIHARDSDLDGIPDGMDTYPLDATNVGPSSIVDNVIGQTSGLHLHVQNPILSYVTDLLSIFILPVLVLLVLCILWFIYEYWKALTHYVHYFNANHHSHEHHGHETKSTEHNPLGIAGLAIGELHTPHPPTIEEFETHPRWAIIEGYMSSTSEALWRIGVLEADTMLEEVLKEKGYQGESVGDMLKTASFKTVRLAWDAHMVRNQIAHQGSNYVLTEREAKRVYTLYEAVFKELKAIA